VIKHEFVNWLFELLAIPFRGIASGDPFGGGLKTNPKAIAFVIFFFKRLQKLRF